MAEFISLIIGIAALLLGIPIGNWLARATRDESRQGQKWFRRIIILSIIGAVVSLIVRNDSLLFAFAFMAILTSRSLRRK